jgi:DNA polymerase-3 subunit delta'
MADDPEEPDPFRPRANPDLVGHQHAEQSFLNVWQSGRLPHGWLITGQRGIGKATLAFRIARFVLSGGTPQTAEVGLFGGAEPETSGPLYVDPELPVSHRVASGGHADLMTLERTINPDNKKLRTTIVVGDVRKAGDFFRLTAAEGGWRVVIVDCVDELNLNAANALLKMLEEPPARALLLLVSHRPGRLLATIRSRCCYLPLTPLPEEEIQTLIGRYRPNISEDDRRLLSNLAEGSVGRALELADEGGIELYRELILLLSQYPNPATTELHLFGDRLARRGAEESFRTVTELLSSWIGRMTRSMARHGAPPPAIIAEEEGCAIRLMQAGGVEPWLEVWEKINRLADQADRLNLDRKQILFNMFHTLKNVGQT